MDNTAPKNGAKSKTKKEGPERLNLRKMPKEVVGIPEEFLAAYEVRGTITGLKQVVWNVFEKKNDSTRGREIPFEEINRLSRAAGFVRTNDKTESKDKSTLHAKALFFQAKEAKIELVKNPKLVVETAIKWFENLEANRALVCDYEPTGEEDKVCILFYQEMLARATAAATEILTLKLEGKDVKTDKDLFVKHGLPASMRSKTLTGKIEIGPSGKFWTCLLGKELSKFCQLTVEEVNLMNEDHLEVFELAEGWLKLKNEAHIAAMLGMKVETLAEVPERMKKEILSVGVPMGNLLNKLQTIRRYASTKERIRGTRGVDKYPWLEAMEKKVLKESYFAPPEAVADVKEFWEKLCEKTGLIEPAITSRSYREQAIEHLENTHISGIIKKRGREQVPPRLVLWNREIPSLVSIPVFMETTEGDRKFNLTEFKKYEPRQLYSAKTLSKKKALGNQTRKHNELTKKSLLYLKGLEKKKMSPAVLAEVRSYLEEFVELPIQEMAAHIVYMTCLIPAREAQEVTFGIADSGEDEEDDDGGDDPADEEDKKEDSDLPDPYKEKKDTQVDLQSAPSGDEHLSTKESTEQ